MTLSYAEQPKPDGLAHAFIIGADFVGSDHVALVLGNNIFYGQGFKNILSSAAARETGATKFGNRASDPERYGVVEFNGDCQVVSIEEKPIMPKSNYAVPGLYFYDNDVLEIAANLKPSRRGELEITDVNRAYMQHGDLAVEFSSRGFTWLDTGTKNSLLDVCNCVSLLQKGQVPKIACFEELAFFNGFMDRAQLLELATEYRNEYGTYLDAIEKSS